MNHNIKGRCALHAMKRCSEVHESEISADEPRNTVRPGGTLIRLSKQPYPVHDCWLGLRNHGSVP